MEDGIGTYWREFLETPEGSHRVERSFSIWGLGDSPEMADKLGALVKEGVKTVTCSLLWEYEFDNEKLPAVGELSIITDGLGAPMCIIETTEVEIKPYDQVDETFAYDEGEGDRSLAYWRKVHWHFFGRSCERIGRDLRQDMPLICERFHLIYTES